MALSKREMGTCEKREGYIHCEVKGAIVNIREGLTDLKGRNVTSVSIVPDDRYAGEPIWKVVPQVYNIRIIQLKKKVR